MTQKIFDTDNEEDMALLWSILPENIVKIRKAYKSEEGYFINFYDTKYTECFYETAFLIIDWHNKTEITRPIQEVTEADIGKLCVFWNYKKNETTVSLYKGLDSDGWFLDDQGDCWKHCRRLTKKEIEELC